MGYSGSKEEETELRPQDLFHMSSLGGGYMAWVGHLYLPMPGKQSCKWAKH